MSNFLVHGTTVAVNAPVPEVYQLFTHFDQFPKFMNFVKEVTYLDKEHQRTHWIAHIFGHDEWDAVNEDWIEDRKVGWRSTRGLKNSGRIVCLEAAPGRTQVVVEFEYSPPAGIIGQIIDDIAVGNRFDEALQESMNAFVHLVDTAPPGGLDPNSPNYIFGKSDESTQTREAGVSRMTQAGPTLAPGELGDMVRQPVTGNMVDEGLTPLDLGTVGGGQTPGEHLTETPEKTGVAVPMENVTNYHAYNAQDRTAQSNMGGRHPSEPQTAMGDRDVDATGARERARGEVTAPMTSRDPEKINQTTAQANSDAGKTKDVESTTGESNVTEPPHNEERGSEKRTAGFRRERGDVGQNPNSMPSHEATRANEEENRPQTTHIQNPAETGREVE